MSQQQVGAQQLEYDPDWVFSGSHITFELGLIPYLSTKYEHLSGFEHKVHLKPQSSYEVGFKWRYYINKSWSIETGVAAGGRRILKMRVDLDDEDIVHSITTDPEAGAAIGIYVKDRTFNKHRFFPQFSFPIHFGYHQYLGKGKHHILDYKLGVAVRVQIPGLVVGGHLVSVELEDSTVLETWFYRFYMDYYPDRIVSVDLQPYFGYTFIPKNRHAFSIGLTGNIRLDHKSIYNGFFKVLPGNDLEGSGRLKMVNHYLAIQLAYTLTTKRNSPALNKTERKRQKTGH